MHIRCTRLVWDHTHTPVRVHTCHKNFPKKSFSEPSSFLQTTGILTSWHFFMQKCLIRSFLTSSVAVWHALSTLLLGRNWLDEHTKMLPKHSLLLPNGKLRAHHKKQQKRPNSEKYIAAQLEWLSREKSKLFTTWHKWIFSIKEKAAFFIPGRSATSLHFASASLFSALNSSVKLYTFLQMCKRNIFN